MSTLLWASWWNKSPIYCTLNKIFLCANKHFLSFKIVEIFFFSKMPISKPASEAGSEERKHVQISQVFCPSHRHPALPPPPHSPIYVLWTNNTMTKMWWMMVFVCLHDFKINQWKWKKDVRVVFFLTPKLVGETIWILLRLVFIRIIKKGYYEIPMQKNCWLYPLCPKIVFSVLGKITTIFRSNNNTTFL